MPRLFHPAVRFSLLSLALIAATAYAKEATATDPLAQPTLPERATRLDTLHDAQSALQRELKQLSKSIASADETDKPALQAERESLQKNLDRAYLGFEQFATGGVDPELLIPEQELPFNWQQELVEIVEPLLSNVKALTEKPRKIERLRSDIAAHEDRLTTIDEALAELGGVEALALEQDTRKHVEKLIKSWQQSKQESADAIELAHFQLSALQGENVSWREALQASANQFFAGRGLTLLIAAAAAIVIWLSTRFVLWLLRRRVTDPRDERITRYRVAAYAYSLLTSALMIVAAIVVFYVRGDVLLLGLSILILAGAALGLRHTLPRYIDEGKLLLNVGALREGERVIYNGIPWKVASLNLYSVLKNPAIEGTVRLPLSALTTMTSRPVTAEPWFPCEREDYLLMPNGKLGQIMRITPDIAQIRYAGGTAGVLATAELYTLDALNLSRNGSFGVSATFGIDYAHQQEAVETVAQKLAAGIQSTLAEHGLAHHLKSTLVDFETAGASSLNYLIFLSVDSQAAAKYFSIERLIQQACVKVCNRENWGIPFPQMTLHSGDFHVSNRASIPTASS